MLKDGVELKIFMQESSTCSSNSSSTYTFTTEEITGCTNETAKDANKAQRNLPFLFFSCFTVLVTPPFIPSFEINKLNPFPTLAAPFPLNLLSNLLIALEVKLLDTGKFSLAR